MPVCFHAPAWEDEGERMNACMHQMRNIPHCNRAGQGTNDSDMTGQGRAVADHRRIGQMGKFLRGTPRAAWPRVRNGSLHITLSCSVLVCTIDTVQHTDEL